MKTETLMPAPPHEQEGWGRFKRIVGVYSTAPIELKLGFGSVWRGIWQLVVGFLALPEPHDFKWDGSIPLHWWGLMVALAGLAQFFGTMYPKRIGFLRTPAATFLAGSAVYITGKYLLHAPLDIAVPLYGTLFIGESWIALRGHRIFGGSPLNGELDP